MGKRLDMQSHHVKAASNITECGKSRIEPSLDVSDESTIGRIAIEQSEPVSSLLIAASYVWPVLIGVTLILVQHQGMHLSDGMVSLLFVASFLSLHGIASSIHSRLPQNWSPVARWFVMCSIFPLLVIGQLVFLILSYAYGLYLSGRIG